MNLENILKRDGRTVNNSVRVSENTAKGEQSTRPQVEVRSLTAGQTIQGEVIARSGKTVQIALAEDLLIQARLEQNVNVQPGKSMCFEIVKNNGMTISLSPLYANMANGETIQKALDEAGVMQTKENLQMVSLMMEEGMPINRDSVLHMSRLLGEYPSQNPLSLIQMTRLNIPVSSASLEQFEQYSSGQHPVVERMQTIMDGLSEICSELLAEGKPQEAADWCRVLVQIFGAEGAGEMEGAEQRPAELNPEKRIFTEGEKEGILGKSDAPVTTEAVQEAEKEAVLKAELQSDGKLTELQTEQPGKPGEVLGEGEAAETLAARKLPSEEVFRRINQLLSELTEMGNHLSAEKLGTVKTLLGEEGIFGLLKEEIQKQWMLEPEQVAEKERVEQLYERIREQTGRVMDALEHIGKSQGALGKNVQNLQQNVDFMNQLNQMFTYVQLPLKMMGNRANGDLYVYTNKKSLAKQDGNVSAYLHLDMENLGAVDVYVTMQNKKVNTNFTLENDEAIDLIASHIGILEKRLAERGYDMNAKMEKRSTQEEGEGAVMQTMLEQSKNISLLGHTSFDMRA